MGRFWLSSLLLHLCAVLNVVQAADARFQPILITDTGGPDISATYGLAASPDGRWYASGETTGNVKIWSTIDGSEYRSIHVFDPSKLSVSATRIAVSSDSSTVIVLIGNQLYRTDVRTGIVKEPIPVGQYVWDLAASPKQRVVALIDLLGNARVISLDSGLELFHTQLKSNELGVGGGTVLQVRFSPDGELLALTNRTTFELWTWTKQSKLVTLDARIAHSADLDRAVTAQNGAASTAEAEHYFWFLASSFSPDGKLLALCARDELRLIALPSARQVTLRKTEPGQTPGCIFRTPGQLLLGQQDYGLTVLSLAGQSPFTYPFVDFRDYLPLSPDGRGILFAGTAVYLCIPNSLADLQHPGTIQRQASTVIPNALRFTADGKQLLWSNWFRPLTSWSLEAGEASDMPFSFSNVPAFSPDGRQFGVAERGANKLKLYDMVRGGEQPVIALPANNAGATVSFSEDGAVVAVSNNTNEVSILSGVNHQLITPVVADHPTGVAVQPNGALVAVTDRSGTSVFSVGEYLRRVAFFPRIAAPSTVGGEPPRPVEFSRDGQWLAVMDEDAFSLISTQTWTARTLEGQYTGLCLSFSRDSKLLGYVSFTGGVKVIETASGRLIYQEPSATRGCPIAFSADGRTLAARSQDGVDLLALPSGELKASLYSFGGGKELDWLVIAPDGRFDGTPVAWKDLAWRFSQDTFDRLPVEVFFRDFYRPGLLADVLSNTPPQALQDIAGIDRRQPKVLLDAAVDRAVPVVDRIVSLTLTVEEAARDAQHTGSSGARDLRLFRNGTLVQTWRGALGSKGKPAVSMSARVPIVAGPNRFSAYAFSDSGVKSADAELEITGADSLSRKGTAYVIAMGIDHYAADTPQDRLDLQYAEADASAFIQEFTKAQKALDQYARVRVVRLLGDVGTRANLNAVLTKLGGSPASGEQPTQVMLLSALRAVEPEDGVFLFYAGHGAAENGHFYLLPQDYNPLQPLANTDSRAVSELDLSQWLEGIAPERSFLILDACRSGQAIDTSVPLGPLNASGLAQLAYEKGIYILAASKDSESALEAEKFGGGHGLLTYALVEEGLRDGAAAQSGTVELRHWFLYASQRVPDLQAAQSRERRAALINSAPALQPAAGQHPRLLYRREPEVDPFVVATFPQFPAPAAAH